MNTKEVGEYIKQKRTSLGLTQKELAERLNLSFQAVSKWETGETLPDTALLLDLADILKTTVDNILNGGTIVAKRYNKISIEDVVKGFEALETMKKSFGESSLFYKGVIQGINLEMNMDVEKHFANPEHREVLYAEVILQAIQFEKAYVDLEEVHRFFKNPKLIETIEEYSKKYNF